MVMRPPEHNLRSREKAQESLADWHPFNGCFPRPGIHCIDIDGACEVNGHILVLESKPYGYTWPHEYGQRGLLRTIACGGGAVFVIYTEDHIDWKSRIAVELIGPTKTTGIARHDTTLAILRGRIKRWAEWADSTPAPIMRPWPPPWFAAVSSVVPFSVPAGPPDLFAEAP